MLQSLVDVERGEAACVVDGEADGARWAFGGESDFDPEFVSRTEGWHLEGFWNKHKYGFFGSSGNFAGRRFLDVNPHARPRTQGGGNELVIASGKIAPLAIDPPVAGTGL